MMLKNSKYRHPLYLWAFSLAIGLFFIASSAYGLRCGNKIIQEGDSKLYVLKACGSPNLIDPEPFSFFNNEIWEYDRGSNRFMYSIKFQNGRASHIRRGNYGFNY